ncbi:YciI family protein [Kitasatospora sp. NPDC058965]|uniref:YciI family protein n=1 Tax=Kitasatospora sp. NPDC058965 TaxID=3346682 RepID=UPI003699FCA3
MSNSYFVAEYVFTADRRHHEVRPGHRDFLAELQVAGRLVLAGPWADDRGSLLVLRAADEDEVREVLATDPYRAAGVLAEVRIRHWVPVLGSLAQQLAG